MTKTELETLLADIEAIHATTAQAILRLRNLLVHYNDLTPEAQGRIEAEVEQTIGTAQIQSHVLPDFRARAR